MKPTGIVRGLFSKPQRPSSPELPLSLGYPWRHCPDRILLLENCQSRYGDDAVGVATSLVSVVLLLHTLARLGLDIGLIRFLPDETDKPGMINTSFTIVGLSVCSFWLWCSFWVLGFGLRA